MSSMTILFALMSRTTGRPVLGNPAAAELPGAAVAVLLRAGLHRCAWGAYAFMALMGISYGFSSTLFGALWPELYGTKPPWRHPLADRRLHGFRHRHGTRPDRCADRPRRVLSGADRGHGVYCVLSSFRA
jgi:hypothetical protein